MAELHVRTRAELPKLSVSLEGNGNYQKALRFGGALFCSAATGHVGR